MNNFEMLLNELTSKSKKNTTEKSTEKATATATAKLNSLGSQIGEQREIVIRYTVGREEQAKVYEGTPGDNGKKEDSYAMAFALGKLVGDMTGLDGAEISSDILKTMLKSLVGGALAMIFDGIGDVLK